MENYWKTSDIRITTDSVGAFYSTHKYQGDLIECEFYPDRNSCRRASVKCLKEKKEKGE